MIQQKVRKNCFNAHFQYNQLKLTELKSHVHLNTLYVSMEKFFNLKFLNSLTLYKSHMKEDVVIKRLSYVKV